MKKPRPIVYNPNEIIITRDQDYAHIKYKDPDFGETRLQIGREAAEMTDQEIVDLYNDILNAEAELVRENKYIASEPPLGSAQMESHPSCGQWSPRGHVLRCLIDDTPEQEPMITIAGKELSWHEFGKAICTFAGGVCGLNLCRRKKPIGDRGWRFANRRIEHRWSRHDEGRYLHFESKFCVGLTRSRAYC